MHTATSSCSSTWTDLVFSRLYASSRQDLFLAWTEEARLAAWWGPYGFLNRVCEWRAVTAGRFYIEMLSADGMAFPLRGWFHHVVAPEWLVFTCRGFESEDENSAVEVLNSVSLIEDDQPGTRLTLQSTILKCNGLDREIRDVIRESWMQSLDRLDEFLKQQKR